MAATKAPRKRTPKTKGAEFARRSAAAKKAAASRKRKKLEAERADKVAKVKKPDTPRHRNSQVQRDLHLVGGPYLKGADVKELQLAINKISDEKKLRRHLTPDGEFGPHTAHVAKLVVYAIGLRRKYVKEADNGLVSMLTQREIRRPEVRSKAAHRRAKRRLKRLRRHQGSNDSLRTKIVANAKWGVSVEPQIHYAQIRPMPLAAFDRGDLPLSTDCSGFATCCYHRAGAPDPNGLDYNGLGYTGTLMAHLPHIPKAEARPGDLVTFGVAPGTHVVVLCDPGTVADPLCVSHGQESGPSYYRVSVEAAAHAGEPLTYLKGV